MAKKKTTKVEEPKDTKVSKSKAPKKKSAEKKEAPVVEQKPAKEPKPVEKVQEEAHEKEAPKKKGVMSKILVGLAVGLIGLVTVFIAAGVTYLLTVKWEGESCDEKITAIDVDYQTCLSSLDGFLAEVDECKEELDSIEEPVCDCTDIEGPVQTIRIGDHGSLRIPSGWMLAGVNNSYRYLTDAEEADMIKPENYGLWPIYESTEYTLAVSEDTDSVLTITEAALFVPGATGFMPYELTGDYKVLSQEKNDENEIAVRVYDGSDYNYLLAYDNPDYQSSDPGMYSPDVKYLYFDLEYPSVMYSGATKYLEDADQIFIESCLRDSMKLCSGSVFE